MKVCPKCNVSWGDDVKFCSACGEPLPDVAPVAEEPVAEPAAPAVEPVAEPVAEPAAEPAAPQAPASAPQAPTYQQAPPAYQPPAAYYAQNKEEPISTGKWVLYQLIPAIPFVGSIIYLVMLFVWSFGSEKNTTFRNWARSNLILMGISLGLIIVLVVLVVVFASVFATSGGSMTSSDYVW